MMSLLNESGRKYGGTREYNDRRLMLESARFMEELARYQNQDEVKAMSL